MALKSGPRKETIENAFKKKNCASGPF